MLVKNEYYNPLYTTDVAKYLLARSEIVAVHVPIVPFEFIGE